MWQERGINMNNNATITENIKPRYIVYNEILPAVDRFFHGTIYSEYGDAGNTEGEHPEMINYANNLKKLLNNYIDERLKSVFAEDNYLI